MKTKRKVRSLPRASATNDVDCERTSTGIQKALSQERPDPPRAECGSSTKRLSVKDQEDGGQLEDSNFKDAEPFIKKEPFEEEVVIAGSNERLLITKNVVESSDESDNMSDHDMTTGSGLVGGDSTEWTVMTPMVVVKKEHFEESSPSSESPSKSDENVSDSLMQTNANLSNNHDKRVSNHQEAGDNISTGSKRRKIQIKASLAVAESSGEAGGSVLHEAGLDNEASPRDPVLTSIKTEPLSDTEDHVESIPVECTNSGNSANAFVDPLPAKTQSGRPKRNVKHRFIGVSKQSENTISPERPKKSKKSSSRKGVAKKSVFDGGLGIPVPSSEPIKNHSTGSMPVEDNPQSLPGTEVEDIRIKLEPVSDHEEEFEPSSSDVLNSGCSGQNNIEIKKEVVDEDGIPKEALENMVYIHKPSVQVFACTGSSKGSSFKYQCAVCQEVFEASLDLVKHVSKHDVPVNFFCSECENSFPTADAFQQHKAGHLKRQSFRIVLKKTHVVGNASKNSNIWVQTRPNLAEGRSQEDPPDGTQGEQPKKMVYVSKQSNKDASDKKPLSYKFQCAKCKEVFATSLALIKHVTKHEDDVNYFCYDCERLFSTVQEYQIHRTSHKSKHHVCEICNASFSQPWRLKSHKETHEGMPSSNVCEVCGTSFQEFSSLRRHMNCHVKEYSKGLTTLVEKLDPRFKSERETFPCNECAMVFNSKTRRSVHIRYHHRRIITNECKFCRKTFFSPSELKRHLRTHNGEKPYACHECGRSFALTSTLQDHMRRHTGERPFKCSICEKTFSSSSCLGRHKLTHVGKKMYECEQCGKDFLHRNSLKIHTRTHTGARPYKCETCEKTFSMSCHYRVHLRIHTGERPYKCTYCPRDFNNYGSHYRHVRTHIEWKIQHGEAQAPADANTEDELPPLIEVEHEVDEIDTDDVSSELEGKLLKSMLATSVSPAVLLQQAASGNNISKETMASLTESSGRDSAKGNNSVRSSKRNDGVSTVKKLPPTSSVIAQLLQSPTVRNRDADS